MEEQNEVICPWCLTEIIWDEEIGPEKHCPHCENELSGYRTVQIGIGQDSAEAEEEDWEDTRDEDVEEEEEDLDWEDRHSDNGFRQTDRSWLAVEEKMERILDGQEEVPECPACREYMLEAGKQSMGPEQFKAAVPPSMGVPVVAVPFEVTWYVCPACFQTSSMLSADGRDHMIKLLSPKE
ncbi:hypothetical protein ACFO9Q_09390 [Paenibacillus sp. GCM10023252]|uniref:hypothetical protein n=1 Tax=Paenibacillus sp. GCM10023252 TaxID=3252649 RepID=UPI00361222E2